jgi:hypothetical protein
MRTVLSTTVSRHLTCSRAVVLPGRCSVAARPKLIVVNYPETATLYLLDGTLIPVHTTGASASFVPYDASLQGYYVRVRPPLNKYSPT